jgi:uncharacterized protein (DUF1697 family)
VARYVALFASIAVAGNRLTMADLRAAFEAEGFANVETVVSSDNLLFDHPERPDDGLEEKLAIAMRERFAMKSAVLVRSRSALAATIAANPFASGDDKFAHTLFFDGPLEAGVWAAIADDHRSAERLSPGDRAVHIDYVANAAEAKVVCAFLERRLARRGAARSLRSLKRILAKMDEN